jgi:hypothetical protein
MNCQSTGRISFTGDSNTDCALANLLSSPLLNHQEAGLTNEGPQKQRKKIISVNEMSTTDAVTEETHAEPQVPSVQVLACSAKLRVYTNLRYHLADYFACR